MLYPIKFHPLLKSLVWGGNKIRSYKGLETDVQNIGESWELSGVSGDESVVAEGPLEGKTIVALLDEYKDLVVGRHVYAVHGNRFPQLIKFIDATSDLSLQVHPNDELAALRHNGLKGKTELLYIVDAEPGSYILSGFSKQITPEQFERMVADNTIMDVVERHDVKKGDVFFLPAGRVHAICRGCFIAEIEQTSNLTYRIYDYGRLGLDGKPRELHTALAKDAIDYKVYSDYQTDYVPRENENTPLVDCRYFTTSLLDLLQPFTEELAARDSFTILICTEGEGTVTVEGDNIDQQYKTVSLRQGETVLIPACATSMTVTPSSNIKVLTSYIK
jgi:hypothetical protein